MRKSKRTLACIIALLTLGSLTILPVSANNDSLENENVATVGESGWGYSMYGDDLDVACYKQREFMEIFDDIYKNVVKANPNEVIEACPKGVEYDDSICFVDITAKTETGKQIAEDYCTKMGYNYLVRISVDPDLSNEETSIKNSTYKQSEFTNNDEIICITLNSGIDDEIININVLPGGITEETETTIGESSTPSEETLQRGDVNGDGKINVLDLLQLKKYILKIIDTLE